MATFNLLKKTAEERKSEMHGLAPYLVYKVGDKTYNYGGKAAGNLFNTGALSAVQPTEIISIGAGVASLSQCFVHRTNLKKIHSTHWDLSSCTNLSLAFSECSALKEADFSKWAVASVNVSWMFDSCLAIQSLDLSNFAAPTNLQGTFYRCRSLKELALPPIATGVSTGWLFEECNSLADVRCVGLIYPSIDIHWSPLTAASVIDILAHLATSPDSGATVTFKSGLYATYTTEEKAIIDELCTEASINGWTVVNMAPALYYGVEFDTTVSSPACTRIGNPDLHRSLPIQSAMKGCLLDDDGEVVEYLPADDWTGATRDGSLGQVMVEIPEYYCKFEEVGTKRRVMMSLYPIVGYQFIPKRYVSAYQATVDRTNGKLASVRNFTAQYRGCANQAAWDGTYRSALGKPATSISLTSFRSYARARKAGSTAWNCHTYGTQKTLYWLFVVEYATLNSQAAFNAALDANGYHQGGLGDGVTNADGTKWNTYNSYYPFIECGATDSLGNGSGQVSVTVLNSDETVFVTTNVNRYRGVEIPFGHVWQWADGVLVEAGANDDTGLHKVFVASDPASFASIIGTGYNHVGNEARTTGYGKTHIFGEGGEFISATVGGSATAYLCDYNYQGIPASGKATRGVLLGGSANNVSNAGIICVSAENSPSSGIPRACSRLVYLPTTD